MADVGSFYDQTEETRHYTRTNILRAVFERLREDLVFRRAEKLPQHGSLMWRFCL
jgi:hypothetical protein